MVCFGAIPFRRSVRMKYDAIIIGSGQAGNPLAYRLADLGWSVALIEKKHLGGTCINVGCTPTKTMVHRAQVAHYARNAARWGVNASNVSVDLAKIVAQKDEVVLSFRSGRQKQIDKRPNLRLYHGHARFVAPHQLQVGDDLPESEKIFINTGGRPTAPAIPGLDTVSYLTNESAMQLMALPEHLLILGGRSEEHTSELQSLTNLVCRLLLEKKNKKPKRNIQPSIRQQDTRSIVQATPAAKAGSIKRQTRPIQTRQAIHQRTKKATAETQ